MIPIPLKLSEGHETVVLIPAVEVDGVVKLIGDTLVDFTAPTSAVINKWLNNTSTSDLANGGNISCALKDDLDLGQTDSDTDDDRSICDTGQSQTPSNYNFNANMNGFMDADQSATGVYNLFRDLTFAADVPYVVAQRIGYKPTKTAAADQIWDFLYGWTDNQIRNFADGENLTINETLISKHLVNLRYKLTA